jgi:hypothetical protein
VSRRFHFALLRAASCLIPAREREEWVAEWRAELWYVGPSRRTAFCLGAFRDAYWLRRNSPPPVYLQSPWECLAVLAVLAGLSTLLAFRIPLTHEMLFAPSLPKGLATITNISVAEYRRLPADALSAAFYGQARIYESKLTVAPASRKLFDLLEVPIVAPADPRVAPLVVSWSAWRKHFAGDPNIVGRRLTVAGRKAQVAAILSDRTWDLPGYADSWLLVDESGLPSESRGYVLAQVNSRTRHMSIVHADGSTATYACLPLSEPGILFLLLMILVVSAAILPAVTKLSLGEYPTYRHAASRGVGVRRWAFLAAKTLLVVPIVLFGSLGMFALIAVQVQAHGLIVCGVLAFRWILVDQRRRCPVCLRVLSNPMSIGVPSRTLLDWYGTELVCSKGHGLLHVPEISNSYSEQRWLHLDSSWSGLF